MHIPRPGIRAVQEARYVEYLADNNFVRKPNPTALAPHRDKNPRNQGRYLLEQMTAASCLLGSQKFFPHPHQNDVASGANQTRQTGS
jgi:hypothetical protein